MNNAERSPAARMGELIAQAAKIGVLKKVVFSKSDDPSILRTVITLRTVGGRVVAQAETLRTDNTAVHENIATDATVRLSELCSAFGQVNLITTAGDCELRRSKSGKHTLLGGDTLQISIGQMNAFTPLQLANYGATLANGGTHYKATLIDKVVEYNNVEKVLEEMEPQVLNTINITDEYLSAVKVGMLSVTEDGTGRAALGD